MVVSHQQEGAVDKIIFGVEVKNTNIKSSLARSITNKREFLYLLSSKSGTSENPLQQCDFSCRSVGFSTN